MRFRNFFPTGISGASFLGVAVLSFAAPNVGQGQSASIRGSVRDSAGAAVVGAEVSVDGSVARALTDEGGGFRLAQVPAGDIHLRVRRLGFHPGERRVRVETAQELVIELRIEALTFRLPPVQVRGRADISEIRLAGFNARRVRQVGHFVTRDKLDRMSSFRFVDALRETPGVRTRPLRGGGTFVTLRGASCAPLVFIDGFPAAAGTVDLDMIDLASVEGIEVYHGLATIPPEFSSVRGGERCGVIAIWSRPARPRQNARAIAATIDLERLLAERRVHTADQVTQQALLRGGSVAPVYPESLWKARVPGRVVVEFIVNASGGIEPGTFRVVSATHPEFVYAVSAALEGTLFRAGVLNGRAIRQIVQLPFAFEPAADSGSGGQRAPN